MERLAILTSGGLDSFIARYYAVENGYDSIRSLYINIGQPYFEKELAAIRTFDFPVEIIDCKLLTPARGNMPTLDQQVIPGRNLLFAVIAASVGAELIWLCALDGEMHQHVGSRDKTPEFFDLTSGLLTFTYKMFSERVRLISPFENMSKADIVTWALGHIDIEKIKATSTCYHPDLLRCGECSTCFKRWVAMTLNGIEEDYAQPPYESQYALDAVQKIAEAGAKQDYGHYNPQRIFETLTAIKSVRSLEGHEWIALSKVQGELGYD